MTLKSYKIDIIYQNEEMQLKTDKNIQEQNGGDLERTNFSQLTGLQRILASKSFYSKASSIYVSNIKTYPEIVCSNQLNQVLAKSNANLYYSFNVSALWIAYKRKLKVMSNLKSIEDQESTIINFIFIYAHMFALNDAKQKLIPKQDETLARLRKQIKLYIEAKINREKGRSKQMGEEINKSNLINKIIKDKLQLDQSKLTIIKNNLHQFKFTNRELMKGMLLKTLSYVQRITSQKKKDLQAKTQNIDTKKSSVKISGIERQIHNLALLGKYLTVYYFTDDWVNLISEFKNIDSMFFVNVGKEKGAQIILRILDDAPIKLILAQISIINKIYGK